DAGFFQAADGREFFARDIFRDCAGDKNIHRAFSLGTFVNQRDGSRIVNRRGRVRHAHDGSESAPRRRRRSRGDAFLRRLARFAQVNVQINQAGRNNFSFRIKSFHAGGRGKVFADGGNFAVQDQHVGEGIKIIGGIHHATAGEKQRIHHGNSSRGGPAMQARQY